MPPQGYRLNIVLQFFFTLLMMCLYCINLSQHEINAGMQNGTRPRSARHINLHIIFTKEALLVHFSYFVFFITFTFFQKDHLRQKAVLSLGFSIAYYHHHNNLERIMSPQYLHGGDQMTTEALCMYIHGRIECNGGRFLPSCGNDRRQGNKGLIGYLIKRKLASKFTIIGTLKTCKIAQVLTAWDPNYNIGL